MLNVIKGPNVTWVDIQSPEESDVRYLKEHFDFHPIILEQIIPPSWGTKVEIFPSHLFFVLFYPVYNKERKDTRPRELDIIVTKDVIVTSHYNFLSPLKALFDNCNLYQEQRRLHMSQGAGHFLYYLLHQIWESYNIKISRIDKRLTQIEEYIFQGKEQKMLHEISLAKADIINFWKIIRPQKGIVTSLRDEGPAFFGEEYMPYFAHVRNHWARAMSNLLTQKETVQALEDTNNALLSHKTNEIVKVLTIFSVIMLPLAVFSQLFGMNTTYLPFVGKPNDFWIVISIMVIGFLALAVYFKKKKWI